MQSLNRENGVLPTLGRRIRGETQPYSGHFEVLNADGTFSPVHSEGQNCLYHAIAQANSHGQMDVRDLKREASKLRNEVHQEVRDLNKCIIYERLRPTERKTFCCKPVMFINQLHAICVITKV